MLKQCPKCMNDPFASALQISGNFCYKCGTKLNPCPKCVRCGNRIGPLDKFCENCGLPRGKALAQPTEV